MCRCNETELNWVRTYEMRRIAELMQLDIGMLSNQAVFAGQRHCRLGTLGSERKQPRACTAAHDDAEHLAAARGAVLRRTSLNPLGGGFDPV